MSAPASIEPLPPIVLYGQPVLHNTTRPVTVFDQGLHRLIEAMEATMAAAPGVGLSANQIGVDLRVFVYDCGPNARGHVVNPMVQRLPGGLQEDEEGCLSLPGLAYPTPRALRVRCTGQDRGGQPIAIEARGLLARCFQHEMDHLNGQVYVERLGGRVHRQAIRDIKASPWHGQAVRVVTEPGGSVLGEP